MVVVVVGKQTKKQQLNALEEEREWKKYMKIGKYRAYERILKW